MSKFLLFISCWFFALQTVQAMSPYRLPHVDYRIYMRHFDTKTLGRVRPVMTPLGSAKLYPRVKLRNVVTWPTLVEVTRYFEHIRDLRFLKWKDLQRRISWLYPDNGCYVRAALAVKLLKKKEIPVKAPDKIFVFGNLRAKTPNAERGEITWWYHVAPVVQVKEQKYVLDPALAPKGPVRLKEWLAQMGDPAKMKVAICSSGAYVPSSPCQRLSNGVERVAMKEQGEFLDLEWERLQKLGRKPQRELGEFPPWLKPNDAGENI